MGFGEYASDSLFYRHESEFDDNTADDDTRDDPLGPEDWQDWHSENLLNMWMSLREYHETQYLRAPGTFNSFCEWVYKNTN
jgi:hypothetical protein